MTDLPLLRGYSETTLAPVRELIARGGLGAHVAARYPDVHAVTTNELLHTYVHDLRQRHLKTAPKPSRVLYDERLVADERALGLHTFKSRAHGAKMRALSEIRIAGVFRRAAPEFLRMIVVHELAHLREFEHNKAFYRLCESMEPDYHQLEFDLRLWLTARELEGSQP